MSTQQQIQAWQQAIDQKQQEKSGQETILTVQREQLAKAQEASADADLALDIARKSGASADRIESLQRQVRQAGQAETDARIAVDKTETNIDSLNGSIRYNTAQRDQYQGSLPAQGNPSSTVADQAANVRTDAAEVAPAPTPAANAPDPVPRSAIEEGGDVEAQEALAVRNAAAEPVQDFVVDPNTGEQVPSDSVQAEQILADAPRDVGEEDPFEAARIAREQEDNALFEEGNESLTLRPEDVGEEDPFEASRLEAEQELNREEFAAENFPPEPGTGDEDPAVAALDEESRAAAEAANVENFEPTPVEQTTVDEFGNIVPSTPEEQAAADQKSAEQRAAEEQAAAKLNAINQATLQSLYKSVGSSDWRLRLQLAPSSNYLYNAGNSGALDGSAAGILAPLNATNGVIFPYTPQINTSYKANYEQYDLVHSNYRGVYYKNSRVDDIQIRGKFTAQDTFEADYVLAVIHFFRSVTKMFYGKDDQRGSPPPLVFLSGFGMNQFYGHPCVVTNFQYNLPDNVDYIRATSVNNYGTDLLSRRTSSGSSSPAGLGATGNRILNAGLEKFFPSNKPSPDPVVGSVNSTQLANYVPTLMEIDITLIPVQTRSQVSKQFSLKGFANGDLIKGGFW